MVDETKNEPNWRSPSGWKAAMEDLAAHTGTFKQLLTDSSGTVPSVELVGASYALVAKTQRLLELARKGFDDESAGLGGRKAHGQDESWRGQESGRSDDLSAGERRYQEFRQRSRLQAAQAKAFARGKKAARQRRKGRVKR